MSVLDHHLPPFANLTSTANIEKSMVRQSDPNGKRDDVDAVRRIARHLLENKKGGLDSVTCFLLNSFANPYIEEVRDMLKVSYWSLCDITR